MMTILRDGGYLWILEPNIEYFKSVIYTKKFGPLDKNQYKRKRMVLMSARKFLEAQELFELVNTYSTDYKTVYLFKK